MVEDFLVDIKLYSDISVDKSFDSSIVNSSTCKGFVWQKIAANTLNYTIMWKSFQKIQT